MAHRLLLFILFFSAITIHTSAQCNFGEVSVYMVVHTDTYPNEAHYQFVTHNSGCGANVIAEGGNPALDCSLNYTFVNTNGFAAQSTITTDTLCFAFGFAYDLVLLDAGNDGGTTYDLFENGALAYSFSPSTANSIISLIAGQNAIPTNDSPCQAIEIPVNGPNAVFNNSLATGTVGEVAPLSTSCFGDFSWCESGIDNSMWFYFTASPNYSYTISTCDEQTNTDTQLAVYRVGDCGDWSTYTLIKANDDQANSSCDLRPYASTVNLECAEAGIYYIQIDGYHGEIGDFKLSVTIDYASSGIQSFSYSGACPLNSETPNNTYIDVYLNQFPYTLDCVWTGPNGFTSTANEINNLEPGTYEVTYMNSCGAQQTQSFEITPHDSLQVVPTITSPSCADAIDGAIELSITGATAPYDLLWEDIHGFVGVFNPMTGLDEAQYNVRITDANGCIFHESYSVTAANEFYFDLGPDTTMCPINQLILSGPPNMQYQWSDGSNTSFYLVNYANEGLGAHDISLTTTTPDGCFYTDSILVSYIFCLDVEEALEKDNLSIYPNPSEQEFTIAMPSLNEQIQIFIFDSTGRKVWAEKSNGGLITVQHDFAPGLYQVVVGQKAMQVVVR